MSDSQSERDASRMDAWRRKIKTANRNNIFCHCHQCGFEWVDSVWDAECGECGSLEVERISCWQFPDD